MYGTAAAMFSLLLVVTGVAKVWRPQDVSRAMRALGLWSRPAIGVGLGVAEVVVGLGSFFVIELLAVQAVLYASFMAWVLAALRAEVPLASCGCLGRDDTPPTVAHVVVNGIAMAFSLAAFSVGGISVAGGLGLVAQLATVAVGLFLSYIVLTDGARLAGARVR